VVTASKVKRNCIRATERGREAWSANREPICRWLQCSGLTETTGLVTWTDGQDQELVGLSVGRAAPGVQIQFCDIDTGEFGAEGMLGEVQIAGDRAMNGYWHARLKFPMSLDRLVEGWLHTGDLGRFDREVPLALMGWVSDDFVCARLDAQSRRYRGGDSAGASRGGGRSDLGVCLLHRHAGGGVPGSR
jgi:acyl-CoA synthetase (AMP-forming)/AMP-acid ligase II